MVFVSKGKRSLGLGEVARVIPVTVHYCQIVNYVGEKRRKKYANLLLRAKEDDCLGGWYVGAAHINTTRPPNY